jgi:hypothetical protein
VPIKNIYVLRTHLLNKYVTEMFYQMQRQLGRENVYVLYDATNSPPNLSHVKWNETTKDSFCPVITITEEDCQKINALHNEGPYPGSMHKVEAHIYACYKAIKQDYDYLWLIEYDVYCNDFGATLRSCDAIHADMLTKIKRLNYWWQNKKWFWWDKLEGEISLVPISKRKRCLFPVNRFSKPFLQVLEKNLSKNSGYCEVYFPTLCNISGLILKPIPKKLFGIFRYLPVIQKQEIADIKKEDNRLYHPVKNLEG